MIRFVKFAAGALLFSASPAALAQGAGWTVSEVSGAVVVQDAAGKHSVRRGTVLAEGATLSTGAGARAVVVRGKDFMTVNANSRVRIPASAGQRGVLDVLQDWGNALFQIEKKPNPHFGVRTPYLAAVVKGTTFSITVTEQGSSLQVVEGAVETSTSDGGARELIRPGVVAVVSAADRYRLTVQGQDTKTIDSPQRNTPEASAPAEPQAPGAGATADADRDSGESAAEVAEVQMIDSPITASAADLGKMTDGLVGGSTGVQIASVDAAAVRATAADLRNGGGESGTGKASDNSGAGNNAGGNGNGNGSDNSGAGNNNAGGNGNGNGADNSGPGNSNAGGNGNGSDNSGAGNSNAGGSGNGNGSDNSGAGNNNAGGNGNGNGADNSGPGNSNAGGNGNGNGADNSGPGNNNAGGNGNGNGSDNSGAGNNNAGGNGNGNGSDNSGPGNNNAGGNGNGADNSGPGNSNAGGNSNGDGSDNSGSGNGNAGGNGNGNGNSGTDDSSGKGNGKDK